MTGPEVEWLVATVVVGACAVLSVVGALRGWRWAALPSLLPAAVGLFARTAGHHVALPGHGWIVALSIATVAMAVVSGGPLTTSVLALTDRAAPPRPSPSPHPPSGEILRGGATIGYLERIAVVGAVGLGQFEIVAAVIAVKGLGRFTELSTSEARERFIIGTLVSLSWAGLVAGLVFLPR